MRLKPCFHLKAKAQYPWTGTDAASALLFGEYMTEISMRVRNCTWLSRGISIKGSSWSENIQCAVLRASNFASSTSEAFSISSQASSIPCAAISHARAARSVLFRHTISKRLSGSNVNFALLVPGL